jgi:hypothetical protein
VEKMAKKEKVITFKDHLKNLNNMNQLAKKLLFNNKMWYAFGGKAYILPDECYSYTLIDFHKGLDTKIVSVNSDELFQVFKNKKEEPLTGISFDENLVIHGEKYPLYTSLTDKSYLKNIRRIETMYNNLKDNGEILCEYRDIDGFYEECGQSEFADVILTKKHILVNEYGTTSKHWKLRLAQKLFVKPEEDAKHHITLYDILDNKLLCEIECESKSYSSKQSFIAIDF